MSKKTKIEIAILSIQKKLQTKNEELSLRFNRFLNPEKVNNLLAQCVHLKKLNLRAVKTLPKAKILSALKNLEYLEEDGNYIQDITCLQQLERLSRLSASCEF